MFCSQCGTQIPDGSAFCPACGARLATQAPIQAPQEAPAQPEIPQPATYQQVPAQPDYQPQAFQPQTYDPSAYQQAYQQQASAYQQQPAAQQPPFQAAPAAMKGLTFTMPASIGELFCSYNKAGAQYAESTGLKMKWYKALTVALLYLGAAGNLFAAIQNIFAAIRPATSTACIPGCACSTSSTASSSSASPSLPSTSGCTSRSSRATVRSST